MSDIIYILGAARSGSTLLSILLGNSLNVFDGGELIRIPELNGFPRGIEKNSEKAKFWEQISEDAAACSNTSLNNLFISSKKIEAHGKFILQLLHKSNNANFRSFTLKLFELLQKETGKDIIIDASKYPGRALFLSRQKELNVFYIYLKRNPVDVVNSFQKKEVEQPAKSFISANIYYFIINLFCRIFLWGLKRDQYITVYFENLITNPIKQLEKINTKLGNTLILPLEKLIENKPLETGKMFDGNRLRLKDSILIQGKDFSKKERRLIDIITLAINKIWY